FHKVGGRLGARLVMRELANAFIDEFCCRRPAVIVTHSAERYGDPAWMIKIFDQLSRFICDHHCVHINIAFRMPFRLLPNSNKRYKLGKYLINDSKLV